MNNQLSTFDVETIFAISQGEKRRLPARMKFQVVAIPASSGGDRPTLPENSNFPPGIFLLVETKTSSEPVACNTRQRKRQRLEEKKGATLLPACLAHLEHLVTPSLPERAVPGSYWTLSNVPFPQSSFQQHSCYQRSKISGPMSFKTQHHQAEDKDVAMWTKKSALTGMGDYSVRLLQVTYRDVPNFAPLWNTLISAGCDPKENRFWKTVETGILEWYKRLRTGQIAANSKSQKAALYLTATNGKDDKKVLKSCMIHSLVRLDVPMDMLKVALWQYPSDVADVFGKFPIHHLLSQRARDCAWKWSQKETARAGFFRQEQFAGMRDVLEYFVRANPQAAKVRDNNGFLPLHLAVSNGWTCGHGLGELVEAFPDATKQHDPFGCLPLHLAVSQSSDCQPISSFVKLLQTYPDAAKTTDDNGDLPLHSALRFKCPCSKVILRLIDAFPEAVGQPSGSTRDLVLHMAVKAGWKWHYNREVQGMPLHSNWSNARSHDGQILKRLIDLHEAALSQPSRSERLFPFQQAAASTDVDTTYNLLIRHPTWES